MSGENIPLQTFPPETLLWKGRTSQWIHFWYYIFCGLLALASLVAMPFTFGWSAVVIVFPIVMALSRWLIARTTVYELTSQRLKVTRGVLNRRLDELELYRVKDYLLEQPLLLRLLKLGNITLISSDAATPMLFLAAIANVGTVREQIREAVQSERDRKRVRQMDIDESVHLP